ncbi:MAG: DUF1552 domain-containing protein [Acidobacteriia bacterium]|nr:DUF1552 domain-containing protein [Terriglobia bacterium]
MRFVSGKSLSRRTLLRGAGAALALPLLDGMVPAFAAPPKAKQRLGFVYVPHGMIMERFTPAEAGSGFALSPILQPLEPFRRQIVVVSGLEHKTADNAAVHSLSPPTWLSGVRPAERSGDIRAGITADQIAAEHIGQDTSFPSLELATEDHSNLIGACDGGFSCTYINTLSWKTPTTPLPMEINPRVVFERFFGEGGTVMERKARVEQDRSILDGVAHQANRLKLRLGPTDRETLDGYLDNVREVERRIQKAENSAGLRTEAEAPLGIPETFEDHVKLMFDLQVLAFQADLTRICTFMLARELSQRTYPQIGSPDPHHSVSHHQNEPGKIEALVRIQTYHMKLFSYYLDRLRNTPDGEGSLLDHALILYGGNMSNSNLHNHFPLPVLLAGGGAGALTGDRHLKCPDHTPMTNLLVSVLRKLDVGVERIGDSTGTLAGL